MQTDVNTSLSGRVAIVTGATNGIGKITALELTRRGCRVFLVGRDPARTEATKREITNQVSGALLETVLCDLSEPQAVAELGRSLRDQLVRLDLLVNNAGAIFDTRQTNSLGWERTFALNHAAYFILTAWLVDVLKKSAPARIINVSSEAHRSAQVAFDDLQLEQRWTQFRAYGQSKLLNILFTRELARHLQGTQVTANSVHPGLVATGFGLNNRGLFWRAWGKLGKLVGKTPEDGAATTLYVATAQNLEGVTGRYFADAKERTPSKVAQDDEAARRLWAVTEQLTAPFLPQLA